MLTEHEQQQERVDACPGESSHDPETRQPLRHKHSSRAHSIYAVYKWKCRRMRLRSRHPAARDPLECVHSSLPESGSSRPRIGYAASAPETSSDSRHEFFPDAEEEEDENVDEEEEVGEEDFEMGHTHRDEADADEGPPELLVPKSLANKELILSLLEIDRLEEFVALRGLQIRPGPYDPEQSAAAARRLSRIGEEIIEQLVEWTKVLPFYNDLPVEVHTHLLTHRWPELVLVSAAFFAVSHTPAAHALLPSSSDRARLPLQQEEQEEVDEEEEEEATSECMSFDDIDFNLRLFQQRLEEVMDKEIPFEHVQQEAGPVVGQITGLVKAFAKLKVTPEAYVCLKAIILLNFAATNPAANVSPANLTYERQVQVLQDQWIKTLQIHLSQCESGPRLSDVLNFLLLLGSVASDFLTSKMFYVPFMLCKKPGLFCEAGGAPEDARTLRTAKEPSPDRHSEANCTSSSISDVDV